MIRCPVQALRSSAYDEIYRLEDECRQRTADAAAARQRAAQMEHAVRGRERELAKARDEKEAARAAEKERVRVGLSGACDAAHSVFFAHLAHCYPTVATTQHISRGFYGDSTHLPFMPYHLCRLAPCSLARMQVAEEVSVRLETELQATKVRLAQAEGQLRGRERELGRLAELLRQTQGTEYEAWLKTAKVEEGAFGGGRGVHG